jgi:hypothetical protein
VAVHDDGRGGMFDVAWTATAVDIEGSHGISGVPAEWLERIFGCSRDVPLMSRTSRRDRCMSGGSLKRARWLLRPTRVHTATI